MSNTKGMGVILDPTGNLYERVNFSGQGYAQSLPICEDWDRVAALREVVREIAGDDAAPVIPKRRIGFL